MPQVKSQFTPEHKLAFEEKYNLGVYSHETLIELLMQFDERLSIQNAENVNGFFDHDKRILALETENKELREMLMEIAKASKLPFPGMPEMSGFYGTPISAIGIDVTR